MTMLVWLQVDGAIMNELAVTLAESGVANNGEGGSVVKRERRALVGECSDIEIGGDRAFLQRQ